MSAPSLSLEGRVAIVTGSRRGIGRAIALRFAEAGADVAVCDYVSGSELDGVAKEIRQFDRRSLAMQVDIRDKASVNNFVQKVEDELGSVDILANVAGVEKGSLLVDLSEEEWDRILDTNLKGTYLCCQAVVKGMIKRKKGNIINIASVEAFNPLPTNLAYSCSKAGVRNLTNGLAFELGRYNIRVNAIAPGWVETDMTAPWGSESDSNSVTAKVVSGTALGRMSKAPDIANVALFLASDLSSFVTGVTWRVDGGFNPPPLSAVLEKV